MISLIRPIHVRSVLISLATSLTLLAQTNVLTQHNDIGRTGQNISETILTTGNVNASSFGKLFTLTVDGQAIAQPLYMSSVTINGTAHRTVFVATEHDSVYAFDAATGAQLWKATMLDSAHGAAAGAIPEPESDNGCGDISEIGGAAQEYGITGTGVIDASTGTLYLVSKTFEGAYPVQRLHALDIATGNEKFNGPVTISASVSGNGAGSSNNVVSFDPRWENQRAGLLELNGYIFIGFGSHCDSSPWHGWILGYNAATLTQTAIFNSSPNGSASGVWMGGAGIAADIENGVARLFPVTGNGGDTNGGYDAANGNYGDDILRLNVSNTGALSAVDQFTPYNQLTLSNGDLDVGSGGALILPDQSGSVPHLLVQLGKSSPIYLVNRENLGGYNTSSNKVVQQVTTPTGLWGLPAYWNGNLYVWPSQGSLSQYTVANGALSASPVAVSPQSQSEFYGSTPSISANGTQSGIVWSVDWSQYPQTLYAHNAANVSQLLWSSNQNAARDSAGKQQKFSTPTVADGNVFIGAVDQVMVYGLLSPGFSLSSLANGLTIAPGYSITTQVFVAPVNGFTGAPAFSITGLPPGVTATFSPAISNSGTTLTLFAAANAPITASAATFTITGVSGSLASSLPLSLNVTNAGPSTAVNLTSAGNVYGIFNNGIGVTNGGLDTYSYAYSANLLGSSLSALGVSVNFAAPGTANAVANTTIPLPAGNFTALKVFATAVNGSQTNQTFVVNYADGTTSTFTQSLSDWGFPQNYSGETIVLSTAYRISATGATQNGPFDLYGYSFTLNSAKTVKSVTLPANRNVTVLAVALTNVPTPISVAITTNAPYANLTPGSNSLTFNVTSAGALGTPLVFTEGAPSSSLSKPDFVFSTGGTTCTGSVNGPTCTVGIQFTPQFPGLRRGAVKIVDANNNLLATAFIQGVGSGIQSPLAPSSQKTIYNTGSPRGVAVDGAGDVFLVDNSSATLYKIVPGGTPTALSLGLTLNSPFGVALDAAGNLFIADTGNNRIVELPYGKSTATPLNINGLIFPEGVAVDGAGNLLIANTEGAAASGNGNIVKIAAGSGVQSTVATGGLGYPSGVAFDAAGDIFFADWSNQRVVEIPANGGSLRSIGSALSRVSAVAVDAAGDVFIADELNNRLVEVHGTASGPGTGTQLVVATGLSTPYSLAFDGQGDLFIANVGSNSTTNGSVVEIPTGLPAQTITFNSIAAQTFGTSIPLTATASSGLTVAFTSSTAAVCTVSGTTATLLTAGTCTIVASQAGNSSFAPANPVSQSFNVNPPTVVTALSVTPSSGGGTTQTFTASYYDPNGASGLNAVYILFNKSISAASGCYVQYYPASGLLFLKNDAGTGYVAPSSGAALGSSTTLANSQCSVSAAAASYSLSANTATLSVPVTFSGSSATNTYLYASEKNGTYSGWVQKGTWGSILPPTVVSLSPNSGTGVTQAFTTKISDPNGASNVSAILLLANTTLTKANGCYVEYYPSSNLLYLKDNTGTVLSAGVTPGSSATVSNSQCTLAGTGSSYSASGLTTTLTVNLTFSETAPLNLYVYATDKNGAAVGWITEGTWTP